MSQWEIIRKNLMGFGEYTWAVWFHWQIDFQSINILFLERELVSSKQWERGKDSKVGGSFFGSGECIAERQWVPQRGSTVIQRRLCIFLGRSSDSVPEIRERVQRLGGSIFQTVVDQLAKEKVVLSCGHAILHRLTQWLRRAAHLEPRSVSDR